jgi:Tol biopolymer transport system component
MLAMLRVPTFAVLALAAVALPIVPAGSASENGALISTDTLRPELWGVGVVSTAENELNAAFTPDGRIVYFTRKGGDGRFAVILESHQGGDGRWSAPVVASFSGQYPDYDPILSPDGQRLLYISKRPVSGGTPKSDFDIWVVDRTTAGWSAPRRLEAPINSDGDELYPSVATDGTLYFSSCGRGDSKGRCDLYRTRLEGGHYTVVENLGGTVNTTASETDAYVAPDQSYLVFAAYGRADGAGDGDLFVSHRRGDGWTAPRPLGHGVNTVAREYCPIVSPDGRWLYFTSQRGFTDGPQARRLTARELTDSLRTVRNGQGDIYRIPIAILGSP